MNTAWIFLSLVLFGCSGQYKSFSQGRQSATASSTTAGTGTTPSADNSSPVPVIPVARNSPSPGNWVNVTSNLSGLSSECGNMTYVSSKPSEDLMIAGVAAQGLYGSRDGGSTWSKLGMSAGSANITNRPSSIVYDPADAKIFYESGIYNGQGIFATSNSGRSFSALGNVGHNDSVSVDFSDPNRQTLLAGGHEQKQTIYRSMDGGKNWMNVGAGLPAGTAFSSFPLIINSRTFFAGLNPSWGGGMGGIFQSNDSGTTWTLANSQGGGSQPLVASDGSIYWPNGDGAMMRGTGSGSNWTFTQTVASGTLMNVHPVELADGKIASLSDQHIMVSSDKGKTWQAVGPQLPFTPVGLAYSPFDKSIFIWQFDCGNKVLPNAIMKYWL